MNYAWEWGTSVTDPSGGTLEAGATGRRAPAVSTGVAATEPTLACWCLLLPTWRAAEETNAYKLGPKPDFCTRVKTVPKCQPGISRRFKVLLTPLWVSLPSEELHTCVT